MKRLLLAGTVLAGLGSSALAADSALTLWNDANPGGAVTATGTGSAVISGSSLGGITISTSGVQRGVVPGPNMTESNLFITNTSGVVQTLDIIAGTNGFLGPGQPVQRQRDHPRRGGADSRTVRRVLCLIRLNTLNGVNTGPIVGTQLGGTFDSGVLTGPFSFSFNSADVPFSVTGLFGMAEGAATRPAAGGVRRGSIDLDGVRSTRCRSSRRGAMACLGSAGVALMTVKRRKTALYASL